MSKAARRGPLIITILVVLLLVLHQDNWFWNDPTLVFGFIPIGLFWHACLSVAASLTWFLASKIAWPIDDAEAKALAAANPPPQPSGREVAR